LPFIDGLIISVDIQMGAKIPRPIKLEVIKKWLQGNSRDQIAREVGIGAGTVTGIINECRQKDLEFDLLREVAVKLKNQGVEIGSFAPLVRLREILEEKEWLLNIKREGEEIELIEKLESLIISMEVFCFKQGLSVKAFFDQVREIYWAAEKYETSLDLFPDYIKQLESNANMLIEEIRQLKQEKQHALNNRQITANLLEEFQMSRPLFEKNQELKLELEQVKDEKDGYKIDLYHERLWKRKEQEIMWSILERELDKANKELGSGRDRYYYTQLLNPPKLKAMVMDVYNHPSKYIEVIRKMMECYDSYYKEQETMI